MTDDGKPNEPENTAKLDANQTKEDSADRSLQPENILELLQHGIVMIVGLAAILTASGYVTVYAYIGQYGHIVALSYHSHQYIGAGVSMLLVMAFLGFWMYLLMEGIAAIPRIKKFVENQTKLELAEVEETNNIPWERRRDLNLKYLSLIASMVLIGILGFIGISIVDSVTDTSISLLLGLMIMSGFAAGVVFSLSAPSLRDELGPVTNLFPKVLAVGGYTFVASWIYGGLGVYESMPRTFGGGNAIPISLVFVTDTPDLGVPVDGQQPVCLLADLTDGLLIYVGLAGTFEQKLTVLISANKVNKLNMQSCMLT